MVQILPVGSSARRAALLARWTASLVGPLAWAWPRLRRPGWR